MVINSLLNKGVSYIRTPQTIKPEMLKGLRYIPELADTVTINLRKLSKDDLYKWDESVKSFVRNNFKGLDVAKNLDRGDRFKLKTTLHRYHDIEPFLLMATGGRPAMSTGNSPILHRLNSNKFKVLSDKISKDANVFIFNKDAMLENIDKNKGFYTKRLNLSSDTSSQKVFQILTCKDSPLNTLDRKDCQDIIGVMFGYPIKNCVIFQLERDIGIGPEIRGNVPKYKSQLKEVLNSEDSRYSSFGEDFRRDINKTIDNITDIGVSNNKGYPDGYIFIKYVDEPLEEIRIGSQVRNSTSQLDKLNKIEKERQFSRDLDDFDNMRTGFPDCVRDLWDKYGR